MMITIRSSIRVKPCSSWRIACIRIYLLLIHSSTEFSSLCCLPTLCFYISLSPTSHVLDTSRRTFLRRSFEGAARTLLPEFASPPETFQSTTAITRVLEGRGFHHR